jgi:hypothetical protein
MTDVAFWQTLRSEVKWILWTEQETMLCRQKFLVKAVTEFF